jgi:hypothetical protein
MLVGGMLQLFTVSVPSDSTLLCSTIPPWVHGFIFSTSQQCYSGGWGQLGMWHLSKCAGSPDAFTQHMPNVPLTFVRY